MRTRAWAMKDTNTQLASWTQLRHDTILYTKQSYGIMSACDYPSGYVDPRPVFWEKFTRMSYSTAKLLRSLNIPDYTKRHYARFYDQFGNTLEKLRGIAEKELNQEPMSVEEAQWLKTVVCILISLNMFYVYF
jgi:hypothetical protein